MSKADVIEMTGTVVEKLPNAMFHMISQRAELPGEINNFAGSLVICIQVINMQA